MDGAGESIVSWEQAKSGRSTCRATGERIPAGEWRVGFETFIGGRVATAWMMPLPFLRDCCRVEYCLKPGNQGACKATRRKFVRGDVRFVCTAGDPAKKIYLSLGAAGAQLQPVLHHVGRRQFSPTQVAGLAELAEEDRKQFYKAFGVAAAEAAKFDKQHPPPPPPALDKPASKDKRAADSAAEGAGTPAEERPAKRARSAEGGADVAAADVAAAQSGGAAVTESGGTAAAEPAEAADSSDRAAAPAEDEEQGLTEYERQRLEQIRRNRERMLALNLPGLASELAPPPAAKPTAPARVKGVSSKRLSEQVLPRRESARVRGIAPDGSEVHSERQGKVVVVAGEVIRQYVGGTVTEEVQPQERHPLGPLPFRSANADAATDEAFIQLLAHAAASADISSPAGRSGSGKAGGKAGGKGPPLGLAVMQRLQLAEEDVAKVTKDATTHLAFHPAADTLLLACADKKGSLGLWHVNQGSYELPAAARRQQPILQGREESQPAAGGDAVVSLDGSASGDEEPSGGDAEFDGVLSLQAQHYQYICGLKWAGGSGRGAALFTAAYDGSLRRLDVEAGLSTLVVASEEDEYSCMDVTGDGRTALLGDNEGALRLVDVRAGAEQGRPLTLHSKKINTVHFEPVEEQVFATASTDTSIQLWDVRKLGAGGKPLAAAGHSKGVQSALFAPDGSRRLVSTSFDNTLRIWDGRAGLAQLVSMRHDNNTGRWVLPFRACWTAAGDGVVVGNMKRFVDVFDASSGQLAVQLHSEHMTAIASRNAVHPVLPVLASATNSGRIHVYR